MNPSSKPSSDHLCTLRTASRIAEVQSAKWDALADEEGYPFTRHAFLAALEEEGCVGESVGWIPCHLLAYRESRLVGAMPLYIKLHSQGEFVFDWNWAEAWNRHGMAYYPKLVSAIPFTPSTGPRLLVHPEADGEATRGALAKGAIGLTKKLQASSFHCLFPKERDRDRLEREGLLPRTGIQFHWENRGYRDFDEFLASLTSKRRKEIRRERRDAAAAPVAIEILKGRDTDEEHWRAYHAIYASTYDRKWGYPALTLPFFTGVARAMPDRILLILARRGERYVAGAHCFIGDDTLFGRNWGCLEEHRGLHFEICYYRLIEYCIEQGLARFDAGAQGEHKLMRGFLPVETASLHFIDDPRFREAIRDFLERERREQANYHEMASRHSPYRADNAELLEHEATIGATKQTRSSEPRDRRKMRKPPPAKRH